MNNIIIFYTILLIIIMYILASTIENFQTTPAGPTDQIKEAVKQIYLADVESIRNLSAVATNLQKDGGLVTPANMSIRGKLSVGSAADIKTSLVDLLVENQTAPATVTLKTKLDDNNITLTNTEGAFKISNKTVDLFNINKDGNVMKNGLTTASLTTTGDIIAKGKADITGALTSGTFTTGAINIVAATGAAATGAAATGAATGAATAAIIPTSITPTNITTNTLETKNITIDGNNIGLYIPCVVNICSRNWHEMLARMYEFPHKSCIMFLWNDGNAMARMAWARERYKKVVKDLPPDFEWMNVRHCGGGADFRHPDHPGYGMITATVPPGRLVKIFGWEGKSKDQFHLIGPGYTQVNLKFVPHAIWSGLDANKEDFPDNMNMSADKLGGLI
jgi:hypothetical protein